MGGVLLKPISAIQRNVLGARFPNVDLDETVRAQALVCVNARNCQPLTLGLMADGPIGIAVQPQLPFEHLPTKRLSEAQLTQLVETGIVEHTFDTNQRSLVFAFSHNIIPGVGVNFVVDAVDLQKLNTIGTFGLSLSFNTGLTEDRRIVGVQLSQTAARFLTANSYDPNLVYERRAALTNEGLSWNGVKWVNLKVEEPYRNKGAEGFYGIAQILMTSALRLATEQFFSIAYLLGTGQWQTYYFTRILGAGMSIKHPEYAFNKMMICSFIGQPGFDHAEEILDRRYYDAMCDWD